MVGAAEGCRAGADADPEGWAGVVAEALGVVAAAAGADADGAGAEAVREGAVLEGAALPGLVPADASVDGSQAVSSRAEPAVIAETKTAAAERRRRACADMDGFPPEAVVAVVVPAGSLVPSPGATSRASQPDDPAG